MKFPSCYILPQAHTVHVVLFLLSSHPRKLMILHLPTYRAELWRSPHQRDLLGVTLGEAAETSNGSGRWGLEPHLSYFRFTSSFLLL